jgi:hypothetical protein
VNCSAFADAPGAISESLHRKLVKTMTHCGAIAGRRALKMNF